MNKFKIAIPAYIAIICCLAISILTELKLTTEIQNLYWYEYLLEAIFITAILYLTYQLGKRSKK